ncbi:TPA: hypothetical protein QCU33_005232 [Bacillus cereus]|nr:hypothetical protein [Bacillus cereus]
MDNQNNEMKVGIIELRIQVNRLQETIDRLMKKVNMLEEALAMKVDLTHIQELIKQALVVKKINDGGSVGMTWASTNISRISYL